jgi:hypothetical protein
MCSTCIRLSGVSSWGIPGMVRGLPTLLFFIRILSVGSLSRPLVVQTEKLGLFASLHRFALRGHEAARRGKPRKMVDSKILDYIDSTHKDDSEKLSGLVPARPARRRSCRAASRPALLTPGGWRVRVRYRHPGRPAARRPPRASSSSPACASWMRACVQWGAYLIVRHGRAATRSWHWRRRSMRNRSSPTTTTSRRRSPATAPSSSACARPAAACRRSRTR